MKNLVILIIMLFFANAHAQQNFSKLNVKELTSNNIQVTSTTKGSKPCPVMNEAQRDAVAGAVLGDCITNSTTLQLNVYNGTIWKSAGGGISNWETAFNYAINDVVIESNYIYQANAAHTSSVFASDIANWTELANQLPVGTAGQILQSNGASDPTFVNKSISGKAENKSAVTLEEIQFPNNQLTETATGKYLAESGNKNILDNPSFEHSSYLTSWVSTGTGTNSEELINVIDGKKSLKIVTSAQTINISQSSTLYASQFADGVQCLAQVRVKTNHSEAVNICSINAGVTSTTNCVTASNDNKWGLYKVPFICGATSNGISVEAASGTGTTYIDDAFVGAMDVKGTTTLDTAWESCGHVAADFTGFGTVTAIETQCKREGSDLLMKGKFTSGISTAVEARLALKFNGVALTSKGVSVIPTVQAASGGGGYSTAGASMTSVLIEPSVAYVTFGVQASGAATLTKVNGSSFLTTGVVYSIPVARIPIAGWSSNSDYYSASCGANCVDLLTAQIDTTPTATKENVEWVTSVAKSGTNNQIKKLTVPSGIFTETPNCGCTAMATATAADLSCKYNLTGSTATSILFNTSVNGVAGDREISVYCQKTGADFIASRTIVGSFKDIPTTLGTSGSDIQSVHFGAVAGCTTNCTTGTCFICNQVGNKITSVTWQSTGNYRLNGIDGYKYNCAGTGYDGGSTFQVLWSNPSSTSYALLQSSTTVNQNRATVNCIGKP